VNSFYQELVASNGGQEVEWADVIAMYQAFADPQAAINKFGANGFSGLSNEWGQTKPHTYHWLHNFNAMGTFAHTVTGNNPLSAVFIKNGVKTYVAYNASGGAITVTFSDGVSLYVPAWQMATSTGTTPQPTATPTRTPTNTPPTNVPPTNTPQPTFLPPTNTNVPGGFNAYSQIRAEQRTSASGIIFEACSEGGQNAAYIANGDYLVFDNVNFGAGGVIRVDSRIAGGAPAGVNGSIEYWIDGLTTGAGGTRVATLNVSGTGGWQTWTTSGATASNVTGTHTVYVKFVSGQAADFINLNWFQFVAGTPQPTATPTRTNTPIPTNTPTPASGFNPYARIEAESRSSSFDILFEACSEGGQNAAGIGNGNYLVYNNVNFGTGGAFRVDARVASGVGGGASGLVEFWVDAMTTGAGGTKLGDFAIANTGGWQAWQTTPADSLNVTGTRTLYVKFVSGQPNDYVNLNWFQFIR
jgi:hypothetical protein